MSVDSISDFLALARGAQFSLSQLQVMIALSGMSRSTFALAEVCGLSYQAARKAVMRLVECGEVVTEVNGDNVFVHRLSERGAERVSGMMRVVVNGK